MTLTLPVTRTWDGAPVTDRAAVQLAHADDGFLLRVLAPFHVDPPPSAPQGPTDRLWEHEVVELFVTGPADRYLEVEVGPRGHHLVLRLDGVRKPVQAGLPMHLTTRTSDTGWWAGEARLPRAWVPDGPHRANAYRVHGPPGTRRYLAHAAVPGDGPDFHRLACFPRIALPTASSHLDDDLAVLVAAVAATPVRLARDAVDAATEAAEGDPLRQAILALLRLAAKDGGAPQGPHGYDARPDRDPTETR